MISLNKNSDLTTEINYIIDFWVQDLNSYVNALNKNYDLAINNTNSSIDEIESIRDLIFKELLIDKLNNYVKNEEGELFKNQ